MEYQLWQQDLIMEYQPLNQNQRSQDKEEESIVSTLLRVVTGQRRDTGVKASELLALWH